MDKLIISVVVVLIIFGVCLAVAGFLVGLIDYALSIAYIIGGALMLVIGAAILFLDLRVKHSREKQLDKLR
jgi:hypothetical protein